MCCGYLGKHTGWAEKRITSWLKTLPHTIAASCVHLSAVASYCIVVVISVGIRTIQAPACATTPVPDFMVSLVKATLCLEDMESHLPMTRFWYRGKPSCWDASPLLPSRGSSSLVPGCRCCSLSAMVSLPVMEYPVLCCRCLRELSSRRASKQVSITVRPATITTRHPPLTTHDLINKCCGDGLSHLPLVHYATFVVDDVYKISVLVCGLSRLFVW